MQHLRLRPSYTLRNTFHHTLRSILHKMHLPIHANPTRKHAALLQRMRKGCERVCLPLQILWVRPPPVLRKAADGS
ncbi:hypothetical protein MTR_0026s0230 [Medicago truncatula]|uniref:Uncharacterized protein n=1 Tax=Medicago truncatula TaxID=3880 RepID=A0A072TUR5_MEDTR|nr:hypothetical protein MTR_0026s0230 [Medicago truncatula]